MSQENDADASDECRLKSSLEKRSAQSAIAEESFEMRDFRKMQAERNKIFDKMTTELIQKHPKTIRNGSVHSTIESLSHSISNIDKS